MATSTKSAAVEAKAKAKGSKTKATKGKASKTKDTVAETAQPLAGASSADAPARTVLTSGKADKALADAIELARAAACEIALPELVGEPIDFVMDEALVGTHLFSCTATGYRGWNWAITVTRAPSSKNVTVSETCLLPGAESVLAPTWVPWSERLQPGDIGPGDVTPKIEDDPLLMAGFEASGDEEVDELALAELGLGRPRVLSGEGREAAATRWYEGSHGPHSEVAVKAPAPCSSCGYYVPMPGALRRTFGVCANQWSPADGTVISLDHGCGAHSEVDIPAPAPERIAEPLVDEFAVDPL